MQTELPFYEPGSRVNGMVYIGAKEHITAEKLDLEIKGTEKSAFKRFWTTTEQVGEEEVEDEEGNVTLRPVYET